MLQLTKGRFFFTACGVQLDNGPGVNPVDELSLRGPGNAELCEL